MFHRYAYVPQIDSRDCGVAALATVAKYYRSDYSLAHLRDLAKTDMEGTTALGIVKAAQQLGFSTHAIQTDMSIFHADDIGYPFIAHIVKNGKLLHFVVIYGTKKKGIIVADPDPHTRIHVVPWKQFEEEWTGVALFIAPLPDYSPQKDAKNGLVDLIPLFLRSKILILNIVLAAALVTLIDIVGAYYLQGLIDTYIPDRLLNTLGIVSLGLMAAYVIQQMLSYARQYLLLVLGQRLTIDVMLSYIRHIFKLPMSFFCTRRTGEITSRFTDANTIIDALANTILSIILDVSTVLLVGVVLGLQNTRLFMLTLAALPIYIVIVIVFVRPFKRMNNDVMQANSIVSSSIIEDINGMETIKSFACEQERYERIDKEFTAYLRASFIYGKAEILQSVLKNGVQLMLSVAILWFGAALVTRDVLSVGQLITYNALLGYFINPLLNIINLQPKLQTAQVANNRLNEVFLVGGEGDNHANAVPVPSAGPIVVEHVSYRFGFGRKTLDDVSLLIPQGEKLAIVGMSGSGKTTLAKLLVNFYPAEEGHIYLDGVDITRMDCGALRKRINYLPQTPYIFSGTVLENLTLGSPASIKQEDILQAVDIAHIREDIEALPMGYMTQLNSEAIALSGGQQQRIALARAILSGADVLILDESTSNLDVATESRILDALVHLPNRTIIFIAHRMTVARRCERIIVMEEGRIREEGTHESLLKSNGLYRRFFDE